MNKTEKTELAGALKDKFSRAKVAIFADYKGLEAAAADTLRKKVREQKGEIQVLKNNVARLALKGTLSDEGQEMLESLSGPTMVAFAYDDPAAAAKSFHQFVTENEALKIKDSLMGKKKISAEEVVQLAKLPSKPVLLAQFLGVLNGPARGFVSVLAAVPRGLVTVLAAIEKKKGDS